MTRVEGVIKCLECGITYGTLYSYLVNEQSQVFANRTEPEAIPTYCTECQKSLTRTQP